MLGHPLRQRLSHPRCGPEAPTFALCAAADPGHKRAPALLETIVTPPAREPWTSAASRAVTGKLRLLAAASG
jgi:hypothetical protein